MSMTTEQAVAIVQTDAEYHSDSRRISRSQLVDFIESPRTYQMRHLLKHPAWQKPATKAMDFGTTCHHAILTHRDAMQAFCIIPEDVLNDQGHCKGSAWLNWKRENEGKHHLKASDAAEWLEMWASLQESDDARKLLMGNYSGAMSEVTVQWSHEGVDLRARLDRAIPEFAIADLKTIANADEHKIERAISDGKLHIQAGMYRWAWYSLTGELLPFIFVFVEKSAPFRTVCREVDPEWIDEGMVTVFDALTRLQKCYETGVWPRVPSTSITQIKKPRYDTVETWDQEIEQ